MKALSLDVKLLKALPICPVMASLSLFQNECPLNGLVVVASDLAKLSNKIAYPDWNRVEKKYMVRVSSVDFWKALSLVSKLLKALLDCTV